MKLVKIGVLLCIILILVSCKTGKTERAAEDFRYGTQGLELKFMQNQPPTRVWDDNQFDIVVEVGNKGADEVGQVNDKVYLSGFDPSIITQISSHGEQIPVLEGKSMFNPRGTFDYVDFQGTIMDLGNRDIDKYPFRLFATACYNYKTTASANICIDPDPFSPAAKQKICVPQNVNLGSQGAPIAVDKVEIESSPGRTRFKIYLSNVGGGDVFKEGANYLDKCSPYSPQGLGFDEVEYVRVNKVEVSNINIVSSCKPLNNYYLKLINGRGFMVCEHDVIGSAAYVTPLVTELDYGYRNSISKNIEILSSG